MYLQIMGPFQQNPKVLLIIIFDNSYLYYFLFCFLCHSPNFSLTHGAEHPLSLSHGMTSTPASPPNAHMMLKVPTLYIASTASTTLRGCANVNHMQDRPRGKPSKTLGLDQDSLALPNFFFFFINLYLYNFLFLFLIKLSPNPKKIVAAHHNLIPKQNKPKIPQILNNSSTVLHPLIRGFQTKQTIIILIKTK